MLLEAESLLGDNPNFLDGLEAVTSGMSWPSGRISVFGSPGQVIGDHQYYWSNFPPTTALEVMVEYMHRRHHVERYHQDAKELLGWDQYQGRLWYGFHRHGRWSC